MFLLLSHGWRLLFAGACYLFRPGARHERCWTMHRRQWPLSAYYAENLN